MKRKKYYSDHSDDDLMEEPMSLDELHDAYPLGNIKSGDSWKKFIGKRITWKGVEYEMVAIDPDHPDPILARRVGWASPYPDNLYHLPEYTLSQ